MQQNVESTNTLFDGTLISASTLVALPAPQQVFELDIKVVANLDLEAKRFHISWLPFEINAVQFLRRHRSQDFVQRLYGIDDINNWLGIIRFVEMVGEELCKKLTLQSLAKVPVTSKRFAGCYSRSATKLSGAEAVGDGNWHLNSSVFSRLSPSLRLTNMANKPCRGGLSRQITKCLRIALRFICVFNMPCHRNIGTRIDEVIAQYFRISVICLITSQCLALLGGCNPL